MCVCVSSRSPPRQLASPSRLGAFAPCATAEKSCYSNPLPREILRGQNTTSQYSHTCVYKRVLADGSQLSLLTSYFPCLINRRCSYDIHAHGRLSKSIIKPRLPNSRMSNTCLNLKSPSFSQSISATLSTLASPYLK